MGRSCKHTCSTEKRRCHFGVNIQSGPQSEPGPEAEAAVHGCGGCGHGREGAGHLPPDLRDHGGPILLCFAAVYIKTVIIPQAHLEANFVMNQTSTIYHKDSTTGEYVEHLSLHGTENRQLVDFEEIPDNLINATVAIEDETFWKHHGVNWNAYPSRGCCSCSPAAIFQGGSTITQQLIKNATQYDDVTVKRKILEIFTALDFDKTYSKEQILEWYLNYIYLGEGCYGVATAAQNYFGKELSELDLAECASLISITNNPSAYNPYRYLENNQYRATLVLGKMLELGSINQSEYDEAMAEI